MTGEWIPVCEEMTGGGIPIGTGITDGGIPVGTEITNGGIPITTKRLKRATQKRESVKPRFSGGRKALPYGDGEFWHFARFDE